MDQATYENLLSTYKLLYDNGKIRIEELKNYISKEIKIECNIQSDDSIEYYLFGEKLRTQLNCSFSDIRSKKGFVVTYIETEDENKIKIIDFLRERWFDINGRVQNSEDYPAGYFLEIFDSYRKRFSVKRLNLINQEDYFGQ